ncbi:DNA mismatch repair protein Msh3-like isoform X2 [Clytia hemisphaerica]|uniref:DNA mismatch repair protein Msh3-like isoform X2 n=1 Tax=Clytia hemisphaerica TaxID=252671 RepID=UPI0034D5AC26
MPGIKRKSTPGKDNQQTISRFFKPKSTDANNNGGGQNHEKTPKRQKKVPVIQILDDDIAPSQSPAKPSSLQKQNKLPHDEIKKENDGNVNQSLTQPTTHKITVSEKCLQKLARYSIDNTLSTNGSMTPYFTKTTSEESIETPSSMEQSNISKSQLNNSNLQKFAHSPSIVHKEMAQTSTQSNFDETVHRKIFDQNNNFSKLGTTEPPPPPSSNTKKKGKIVYTPLEKQVLELRKQSHGAMLFVECGYKYRFFGQDAEVASKELNICCHMDHNFMTASIPVHRLNVHLSRLVEKGYKVGVVNQTETAALKATGDNKNAPFTRQITNIYTKATFIDREEMNHDGGKANPSYILAINQSKKSCFNFIAVNPTTSEVVCEQFSTKSISDLSVALETIFSCLKPCELVLPKSSLDESVETFIARYVSNSIEGVRTERLIESPFTNVTKESLKRLDPEFNTQSLLSCACQLESYLSQFKLDGILKSSENFRKFRTINQSMVLDGITLRNLEIFENNTDGGVRGSLFSVLNHTYTPFGRRLLRRWIANPLLSKDEIQDRLIGITEMVENWESDYMKSLRRGLAGSIDLENGLTIISLKKASPSKFIKIVSELEKLRTLFFKYSEEISSKTKSKLLRELSTQIPQHLGTRLDASLNKLNRTEADRNNKNNVFKQPELDYPEVLKAKNEIKSIESKLEEYRRSRLPRALNKLSVEYKCVSGLEYLVEVKNNEVKSISSDWIKISATKQVTRFRPPFVDEHFKKLCRAREELSISSNEAWISFLDSFSYLHYEACKRAIEKVAIFDCLISLSIVAKQPGYCCPIIDDSDCIEIQDGRHPVIEGLLASGQQYVANDTKLNNEKKAMLISGPNMGGKSSYIKQIAIYCILAQIGSYIAASSARVGVLDGIYTRMGANDNIAHGKSTFLVEMEEASRILRNSTNKSLVILDELGRGTTPFYASRSDNFLNSQIKN